MRKRYSLVALVMVTILTLSLITGCAAPTTGSQQKKWPTQSITMEVGASAGGTADILARLAAPLMEKELGQKINVVNTTGASGGTALADTMNNKHDGYTWYASASTTCSLSVLGNSEYTVDAIRFYILAGTIGVLSVKADSPYQTVEELFDAIRAENLKLSAGPAGCPWHVQSAVLSDKEELPWVFVPYQGSNPGILGCLNGEVDCVLCGLSEQAEFIAAGELRPLAMIGTEPYEFEGVGTIPSILDVAPEMEEIIGQIMQFNFFSLPADTDPEIIAAVDAAFEKAVESGEIQKYCDENYLNNFLGIYGDEANALAKQQESVVCWTLQDIGIATVSPEKFGIERPE